MRDDKLRCSCSQLLDHQFVKEPIPQLISPHHEPENKQVKQGQYITWNSFVNVNLDNEVDDVVED